MESSQHFVSSPDGNHGFIQKQKEGHTKPTHLETHKHAHGCEVPAQLKIYSQIAFHTWKPMKCLDDKNQNSLNS